MLQLGSGEGTLITAVLSTTKKQASPKTLGPVVLITPRQVSPRLGPREVSSRKTEEKEAKANQRDDAITGVRTG